MIYFIFLLVFLQLSFFLIYKNYLKTIKDIVYLTTNLWATHHHFHNDYYTNKVGYNIANGLVG